MFDFEKLEIYQVIRDHNVRVQKYIDTLSGIDESILSRWRSSTLNTLLYLSEGTGRMGDEEKMRLLLEARSNVFVSVALIDLLRGMDQIPEADYQEMYAGYEKASKMLLGMYRSYSNKGRERKEETE